MSGITFVGGITGSAVNGGNITLNLNSLTGGSNSSPSQDDVVLCCGGWYREFAGDTGTPGISTSGYTQLVLNGTNQGDAYFIGSYKVMGASPDSQVIQTNNGNGDNGCVAHARVYRSVNTISVSDATPTISGPTTSTTPDPASITTVTNGAIVVPFFFKNHQSTTSVVAPSGYSNFKIDLASDTANLSVASADKVISTAGPEDPGAFTGSVFSKQWQCVTFALRPLNPATGLARFQVIQSCRRRGQYSRRASGIYVPRAIN